MTKIICIADSVDIENNDIISRYLNNTDMQFRRIQDGHTLFVINSGSAKKINIIINNNKIKINERHEIAINEHEIIRICISHFKDSSHNIISTVQINHTTINNLGELQANSYLRNWNIYNNRIYLCSIDGEKIVSFINYFTSNISNTNIGRKIKNLLDFNG